MKKHCRRKDVATVRELLRRGIWPANVPVPDIVLVTGQPLAGPVDQRVSALVEKRDDA